MPTEPIINVGLIGFGLAGRAFHAPVIRAVPGLRLAAILQRHGEEAARAYPDVRVVRTIEELLSLDDLRLIVVATPNDTHDSLARQCLAAGHDVVVDKPLSPAYDEAVKLVDFAKRSGRFLTVYQNRRYDGDFQALLQIVKSGQLGRIIRFESNYDRFRPQLKPNAWRERSGPGAGILLDLAPHLIDHAFVLFGLPEAITADVRIERDHALADDSFDITLHYPNTLRALLRATMLAATILPRFVLHGTRGSYVKHAFDVQEPKLRAGRIPWEETPTPSELQENSGTLTLVANDGQTIDRSVPPANTDYRDFYANVRDVLLGKAKPAVSTEYALNVMRALDLARESSNRHCTLPWA